MTDKVISGSMRATEELIDRNWLNPDEDWTLEGVAQIIDDETGAADMLTALKLAKELFGHPDDLGSKIIARAIAKAEGNQNESEDVN